MTPHGVHACMALHASFRLIVRESRQRSDDTMVHQKFTTGVLRKRAHSMTLATTSAIPDAGATGVVAMSKACRGSRPPRASPVISSSVISPSRYHFCRRFTFTLVLRKLRFDFLLRLEGQCSRVLGPLIGRGTTKHIPACGE